ncbi:MAG: MbnP family protein [Bacteroidota bacterium]
MDIEATNFDITADEPCGDDDSANGCPCTYPIFSFRTDYLFDKVAYTDGGRYQVDGQLIQIDDIQLYLSNFAFRYTSGEWTQVTDTIGVAIQNEAGLKDTILTDDFVLINQQSSFDVGAIQRSGTFDSLRFLVGIMHPANTVNPDSVSRSRHPLTETEMHTGDVGTGYIFSRFVFRKDTLENTVATTLTVSQHIGSGKIVPIQMPISTKSSIESKFFVGTLTINHAKWFDGIKFVTDSDEAMIEKLVANTPTVFSIVN